MITRYSSPQSTKELPSITLEDMKEGSTVFILEAAVAIQIGKLQGLGYDRVAEFFRREYGKTRPAHNTWLMIEAEAENRREDLNREFPDAQGLSDLIVETMKRDHPYDVERLMSRVSRVDYSLDGVRADQREAGFLFDLIMRK